MGGFPQRHTLGQARLAGDIGYGRDHDRLRVLGQEARRPQPLGKVGREVVAMVLPLEPLATLGEHPDLTRDQRVEWLPPRSRPDRDRGPTHRQARRKSAEAARPARPTPPSADDQAPAHAAACRRQSAAHQRRKPARIHFTPERVRPTSAALGGGAAVEAYPLRREHFAGSIPAASCRLDKLLKSPELRNCWLRLSMRQQPWDSTNR